jgi:nifR3 family TIM-barrel protein
MLSVQSLAQLIAWTDPSYLGTTQIVKHEDTKTTGAHAYPHTFRVRDIVVDPAVVLAPMEGVTDLAFRRLIRRIGGPGLTYTEFIASKGIAKGSRHAWRMAEFDPDERPIVLQIYGREPDLMAEAGRLLQDAGASIIDINMGCPSKKVCNHSGGSALMREPELAVEIVRAVRAAVTVPLTVKMRSGFDQENRNAPELAWRFQEEGAEAITIHWRTRSDRYMGTRAVDKIAETVDKVSIPVVGNGDVQDIPSAKAMFDDTGCAGVMVGRGALKNPWSLLEIGSWLKGVPYRPPTPLERLDAVEFYIAEFEKTMRSPDGKYAGNAVLGKLKQMSKYFIEDNQVRTQILRSQRLPDARSYLQQHFYGLAQTSNAA